MASDDEEELALLRKERASKAGLPVQSLAALKAKQRSRLANASFIDSDPATSSWMLSQEDEDDEREADAETAAGVLEEESIEESDLRQRLPLSFGEQEKRAANLEKVHAAALRVDPEPTHSAGDLNGHANEAQEGGLEPLVGPVVPAEDGNDQPEDPYNLPISHEVFLQGHSKAVSCLDVEHSGSRLLSGSRDNSLRLFDFNGMKSTMQSFRELEPSEGHPMLATSWSPTGDAFLAVSGSAQIKIYDRDGHERGESLRGDMYIRDQRNTKGHISPATGGQWNPSDRHTAMTSSEDGTIRLWDTETVVQKTVIKPMLQRAARVSVSACAYNSHGSSIAAGLVDGSIHIWDAKGSRGRSAAVAAVPVPKAQMIGKQDWRYVSGGAQLLVRGAHPPETDITSLAFSQDNLKLLSRAADDSLKVWDLRKFKVPLHVFGGLPNMMSTTGACFGSDDKLAVTGTSAGRNGQGGSVVFIDLSKEAVVRRVAMPSNVVALRWNQKVNQIFVGVGDKSSGAVRVLYSPSLSERGVLLCAHRKPRLRDPFDFEAPVVIHTPHALPLFREPRGSKRHLDAPPKDAAQRFKPDVGSTTLAGTGTGGRIGATGGTLLTQYVLKNQGQLRNPKEEDIRAKILRHSEDDAKTAKLFSSAYEKTQPKRIFAEPEEEQEKDK